MDSEKCCKQGGYTRSQNRLFRPALQAILPSAIDQQYVQLPWQCAANKYAEAVGDPAICAKVRQWANVDVPKRAGFVQEVWHVESFNKNAIAKGMPYRAELAPHRALADAYITDVQKERVAKAQFKRYQSAEKTQRALNQSKYDDMQKIGPADHKGNGVADCMQYKGVKSDPLTKERLDEITTTQGQLLRFDIKNSLLKELAKAATLGCVVGGILTALYSSRSFWQGKKGRKECALEVAKVSILSAASSASFKLLQIGLEWWDMGKYVPMTIAVAGVAFPAVTSVRAWRRGSTCQAMAAGLEAGLVAAGCFCIDRQRAVAPLVFG